MIDSSFFLHQDVQDSLDLLYHHLGSPEFSNRLKHSLQVGITAFEKSSSLGFSVEKSRRMLCAGILHDIGYSQDPSCHYIAGADIVKGINKMSEYASLIAWHSTAEWEAKQNNVEINYEKPNDLEQAILWYSDFTTSHDGDVIALDDRIKGIISRYDPDSPVVNALNDSMPAMEKAWRMIGE